MAWPLTWVVIAGTLPGVFIGYYLRVASAPGRTGEVWVSLDGNGLWRSSDGGRTFAKIASSSSQTDVSSSFFAACGCLTSKR